MKALPHTPELLDVARRVVWFQDGEETLRHPLTFLAYLMTFTTPSDFAVVRQHASLDDFREALEHAPPGVFDVRSWTYWNIVCGRDPVPPMPQRKIPGVDALPQSNSRWS
ncbi:MAG: hypothetical protein U1E49_15070 [Hyphomicrobiaceae bacterium]